MKTRMQVVDLQLPACTLKYKGLLIPFAVSIALFKLLNIFYDIRQELGACGQFGGGPKT